MRLVGVGVVAVAALLGAMWAHTQLDQQRYIGRVKALTAWEGGEPVGETVGEWLKEQYPDGQWSVAHESAAARVSFVGDGANYEWVATYEEIVIARTASEQAEALTPRNLPLKRLLENARGVY